MTSVFHFFLSLFVFLWKTHTIIIILTILCHNIPSFLILFMHLEAEWLIYDFLLHLLIYCGINAKHHMIKRLCCYQTKWLIVSHFRLDRTRNNLWWSLILIAGRFKSSFWLIWTQGALKKLIQWTMKMQAGREFLEKTVRQIAGERGRAEPLMCKDKDPHLTCRAVTWSVIETGTSSNNWTSKQITPMQKVTARISIKCKKGSVGSVCAQKHERLAYTKAQRERHNKRVSGCDYIWGSRLFVTIKCCLVTEASVL